MQLPKITFNPEVMGGKACIRGMRVTAGMIVGLVAAGRSREEILNRTLILRRTTFVRLCSTRLGGSKK